MTWIGELADEHPGHIATGIALVMVTIAVAAIGLPWTADDAEGNATDEGVLRLKNQARLMVNSIPGWLVVKDIEMASTNPDSGTGIVDVVGPFGVEAGSIHIGERSSHSDVDLGMLGFSWLAFAAAELVLGVVLVHTMLRS